MAITPGEPAKSGDIFDIRAFDDYRYYGIISEKYNVLENSFGSGKHKYGLIVITWYSESKNMTEIPCIIETNRPSVTAPFNRRGPMKQVKIFGNQFSMFSGYMIKQSFSDEVMFKRRSILYATMDERMDRHAAIVENASTKFFSVEGMLLLFWQLRYVDAETGEEELMGSIPDITSLSDVDVHCYMRTHLLNADPDTVAYFRPDIAKVTFSPARSIVLVGFYDLNECSFVDSPSFVLDKIAFNSDFIVSHRALPFKTVTPETGYCLPDGYEFVVWRRSVHASESEFMKSDVHVQLVNALLEDNNEMHPLKPFVFSHHHDGNHFMVVYYIIIGLPNCEIVRLSTITLLIMKQASRALDDYAYFSSPNTYRVVKTMEHFRFLFQMMQYLAYVKAQGYVVDREMQALSIMQAAVLLSFAKPMNAHKHLYNILDSFCDVQQASANQLIELGIHANTKILFKRSKSDGRVRYGKARSINNGKYGAWNAYMNGPDVGMLYSTNARMMYVLSNIFIASPSTLQMIDCVCTADNHIDTVNIVSRQIGMPSPYYSGSNELSYAYADNATVVVNEHDGVLLRGHRRLLNQRALPKLPRAMLVDEDESSVASSSTDVMTQAMKPKTISFWKQKLMQDRAAAERAKMVAAAEATQVTEPEVETVAEPAVEVVEPITTHVEVVPSISDDDDVVNQREPSVSVMSIGLELAEKIILVLNALTLY